LTSEELKPAPLKHVLRVDRMPPSGVSGRIEANADERAAIRDLLDLAALDHLALEYRLNPAERGGATLDAGFEARGAQRCVVSLEPVPFDVRERRVASFRPQEEIVTPAEGVASAGDEEDEPEPIVDGTVDLGAYLYEIFAVSLDPYPRAPGASLPPEATSGEPSGPFDALSRLKRN
jgi:uncharacterized metal-binding protein YceD (DUF177 family)